MKTDRILVPIDFSDHSRRALEEANRLANDRGSKLTLMHVLHAPLTVFPYIESPAEEVDLTNKAKSGLADWEKKLTTPEDRRTAKVIIGNPVEELLAATAKHDLVVLGTHGRTGAKHFLLGSVAERVVRGSKCSVLIVK